MVFNRLLQAEKLADIFLAHTKEPIHENAPFTFLMIWDDVIRLGFNRLLVKDGQGGLGLELDEYVAIIRVLSRSDAALTLSLHIHNVALKMIVELAKNEQQEPMMSLTENKIVALARSEAERDYRYNFATEISTERGQMRLSGQKDFCTLAGLADYYVVFAQTNRLQPAMSSVQLCVVDGKDPSIEIIKSNGLDAMMLSSTYSVRFHNYPLSSFELVGEPGDIMTMSNPDCLTLGICAVSLGIVDAALAEFKENLSKNSSGKAKDSEILRWLGQTDLLLRSAELLIAESLSSRPDTNPDAGIYVRRAKAACDLLAIQVTEGVLRFLGTAGIMSKNHFISYRNNALAGQVMPPSLHKCLTALGHHIMEK
jgi:alkylation response protein AidB-like acyl-CoA dehydrogenase